MPAGFLLALEYGGVYEDEVATIVALGGWAATGGYYIAPGLFQSTGVILGKVLAGSAVPAGPAGIGPGPAGPTYLFEASLNYAGTIALYDLTAGYAVANSSLTFGGAGTLRSGSLNLNAGHEYSIQNGGSGNITPLMARIVAQF